MSDASAKNRSPERPHALVAGYSQETLDTRRRYDRIAPVYHALEWLMELRARRWRKRLWSLEVIDDNDLALDIVKLIVGLPKD